VRDRQGRRRIRWNRWAGPPLATVLAGLALSAPAGAETVDTTDLGSMYRSLEAIGAGEMWNDGWTGKGVDVAVIDSGVAPVDGLRAPGKVVNGPDLTWESQSADTRHLDTYGHGTHIAGIIAGREDGVPLVVRKGEERFTGVAPDSRVISLKAADSTGATDVSQVIAAIDWVVDHRRDYGMNIRVLNLSYGTDSLQDPQLDPLSHSVEAAWRKGIAVVVSAGNGGFGDGRLNDPAVNPYVIAVGAAAPNGTYGTGDDVVQPWSEHGVGRNPDVVAPGKSIVGLRNPGSTVDVEHPEGRYGERFFRGSGTSQAAAFVSGAAALLISQRPWITPDRLKALLEQTASPLPNADPQAQGAGMIDLKVARDTPTPTATQTWPRSTGAGTLEGSRGSAHLVSEGVELRGEKDIFGHPFNSTAWARAASDFDAWEGGSKWMGERWTGDSFAGTSFALKTWSSVTWTRSSWRGDAWTADYWTRSSWRDGSWTRSSWRAFDTWSSAGWGTPTVAGDGG
jgi:subtilisin family serine protease